MAKRFCTLLILPDGTSPAWKFHINSTIVAVVSAGIAVSVLAFAFCLYQYAHLNLRMPELQQLRQQVRSRNIVAAKVSQLEDELARLRDLDRNLRVMIGLEARGDRGTGLAQGGSEISSQAALREARHKGTGHLAGRMGPDMETLGDEISSREKSFRELEDLLETKRSLLASMPSIWPVRGVMTSGYGYRASPFTGQPEMHEGVDIAAPMGTPILATADGVVVFAGPRGNYGNMVLIDHGHGVATLYAHTNTIRVKEGQLVKRDQIIASIGISGLATGPHVLYEVRVNGAAVNPLKYIADPTGVKFATQGEAGEVRSFRSPAQLRIGG